MKRCTTCKKIMWPWQLKSDLNFTPTLHTKCHAKIISKGIKNGSFGRIPFTDMANLRKSNLYKYIDII